MQGYPRVACTDKVCRADLQRRALKAPLRCVQGSCSGGLVDGSQQDPRSEQDTPDPIESVETLRKVLLTVGVASTLMAEP